MPWIITIHRCEGQRRYFARGNGYQRRRSQQPAGYTEEQCQDNRQSACLVVPCDETTNEALSTSVTIVGNEPVDDSRECEKDKNECDSIDDEDAYCAEELATVQKPNGAE